MHRLALHRVGAALVLAVFIGAVALRGPVLAADVPGALSGRIQTADGRAVAGASVTLQGPVSAAVTTDGAGGFSFAQVAAGSYALRVAKAGFQQLERDDIVVTSDAPVTLNVTLVASSFSSLQTIGRVSTNAGKIAINASTAALNIIPGSAFLDQGSLQVTQLLAETPGVSLTSVTAGGGSNRASLGSPIYPQLRGALLYETESLIDGHPVSVGDIGTFSPLLLLPALLQSTEIAKGPGAMPVEINYAIGGTINYRTLEPTRDRIFTADLGADGYGGLNLSVQATGSTANHVLDYAFAYGAFGSPGPLQNYPIAASPLFLPLTGSAPFTVNGLQAPLLSLFHLTASPFPQYAGPGGASHFSDLLYLCCTPVTTGYNARGQLGKVRLNFSESTSLTMSYLGGQSGQDFTGTILGSETPLLNASTFAPPAGYTGSVAAGTSIPFDDQANTNHNEYLQENLFQAELRTSIGQTTLLGRAYSGFDSTFVNAYTPGQPGVVTENAWGGIPLCPAGTTATTAACAGPGGAPVAPVTTFFNGQAVTFGNVNPASNTLLLDHVRGLSLEADRTVGQAVVTLSLDRSNHDSSVSALAANTELIQIPAGAAQQFTTALARVEAPLAAHLSGTLAAYYTSYASHSSTDGGVTWTNSSHADTIPRLALSWRPEPDTAVRFAAGGSIAPPFISQLSTNTGPVGGTAAAFTQTVSNPAVVPETAFGYDLGFDHRFRPAIRLTADFYFTNVKNMFLTTTAQQGTFTPTTGAFAGLTGPLFVTQAGNIGNARYEGVEFQLEQAPARGIGYKFQGSLQRAFVYGLAPSFYNTNTGPNTANLGVIQNVNFQGSNPGVWNGVSPGAIPYSQGYAEVNLRGRPGSLFLLGFTYNGPNNAYNEPAFGIFSASARFPISDSLWFQISGYNLTDIYGNPYDALFGGVSVPLINGKLGYIAGNNVGPTTLQFELHKTFR